MSDSAPTQVSGIPEDDELALRIRRFIAKGLTPEEATKQNLIAEWEYTHKPDPPRQPSEPLRGWRKLVAIGFALVVMLSFLGMIGFGLYLWVGPQRQTPDKVERRIDGFKELLTLDEVLKWGQTYGDLIRKNQIAAIGRFGSPTWQDDYGMEWKPADKTFDRKVFVGLSSGSIVSVEITPKTTEMLDFSEVMEHGGFSFEAALFDEPGGKYYDVEVKSKDDHFEMRFTLDEVMFLESVKLK